MNNGTQRLCSLYVIYNVIFSDDHNSAMGKEKKKKKTKSKPKTTEQIILMKSTDSIWSDKDRGAIVALTPKDGGGKVQR